MRPSPSASSFLKRLGGGSGVAGVGVGVISGLSVGRGGRGWRSWQLEGFVYAGKEHR